MSSTVEVPQQKTPRKAAFASFLGSVVEYYDFFIYGSAAALVFPTVFFPEMDGVAGTLASMTTFAVAWVARPFGSFFLGHYGDRIGRKRVLVFTLLLMGVSTFLIGCIPDYNTIGTLAPILLVILRIMQGLSAAGEQSGASSMTLEHSPEGQRGYFTASPSAVPRPDSQSPRSPSSRSRPSPTTRSTAGVGASRSGPALSSSRSHSSSEAASPNRRPSPSCRQPTKS